MLSSCDADSVRITKRPFVAPLDDSGAAARAVEELDDVIWSSIIDLLPMPKDLVPPREARHLAERVSDVVATWQTLLDLRLVSKQLAALLHPREKTVWQRLVLQSFDFSISEGEGFNVENSLEEDGPRDPDEDGEEGEMDSVEGGCEVDPQYLAMRGRYDEKPSNYLAEDLVKWSKMGIYHRPSQYGFLTTLQQQPPQGSWPESEDPFSLFGDIVRLLQLPDGEDMGAGGESSSTTEKYLCAPTEAGPASYFYRCHVMKALGYEPYFWHRGRGIGKAWKGFTDPEEMEALVMGDEEDGEEEKGDDEEEGDEEGQEEEEEGEDDEEEDDDDEEDRDLWEFQVDEAISAFPGCNVRDAKRLFIHLRDHCQDWRSVCCNKGFDGETPVFYVGESKAFPHRWTGYMGQKTWT